MLHRKDLLLWIIIPTYNRSGMISRAINSLRCQSYKGDWFVIVVDDGSTDDTKTTISSYLSDPRFKYFYKENGGVGSARNYGIRNILEETQSAVFAGKSHFIVFLDSDDELIPEAFQVISDAIIKNQKFDNFLFPVRDAKGRIFTDIHIQIESGSGIILEYKDRISGLKVSGEMLPCVSLNVFKNKRYAFPENFNGGEVLLWWDLNKDHSSFFVNIPIRVYHFDAGNSLTRGAITRRRAVELYRINNATIKKYFNDLKIYNKNYLATLYFVMARMQAILGNKKRSLRLFVEGFRLNPFDLKRVVAFLCSFFGF